MYVDYLLFTQSIVLPDSSVENLHECVEGSVVPLLRNGRIEAINGIDANYEAPEWVFVEAQCPS